VKYRVTQHMRAASTYAAASEVAQLYKSATREMVHRDPPAAPRLSRLGKKRRLASEGVPGPPEALQSVIT
jgi:hypothetical protein